MDSVDLDGDQQHGTASAHAGDANGNDAAQADSSAADTAEQNIHNGASAAAPDAAVADSPQHAAEASTSDMHNGDTFSVHLGRPSYTQIEVHPSEAAGALPHAMQRLSAFFQHVMSAVVQAKPVCTPCASKPMLLSVNTIGLRHTPLHMHAHQ